MIIRSRRHRVALISNACWIDLANLLCAFDPVCYNLRVLSTFKSWLLKLPFINAFYAKQVKRYRTKTVIDTLRLAHAAELANTPGELWPVTKDKHAKQILAVRDGNLDIVDRRSYQWPYLPLSIHRSPVPVIKFTNANIRRFAATPIPRRAINLIKNALTSLKWDIVPSESAKTSTNKDQQFRIDACKFALKHPNNTDTWQDLIDMGIDDYCTLGAMVIEPRLTPSVKRPFKMWAVDSSTIRIYPDWTESKPNKPRYAQMMGALSERGAIPFLDSELMYIRDNPRVDSPFGLGKMEVAFESVAALLGVQRMAGRAGSDSVARAWLWWEQGNIQQSVEIVRRHLQNDLEGQSRINLMSGMPKPDLIDVPPPQDNDLLPNWQEMLIRIIANAFDLSPLALGIERDVNRSTGEVLDDKDFRSAIVPVAIRLASAFTIHILHRKLGYTDIEFQFVNLEDPDTQTLMTLLTQRWNTNSITSNGINKALGLPPLTSPFGDLTQFEQQLVLTEAAAVAQDNNAQKAFQRQQQMMEQYSEPQDDDSGGGNTPSPPSSGAPPSPSPTKSPSAPKLGLSKSPITGSVYNAKQIAAMTLLEIKYAMARGHIPRDVKALANEMGQQEPGILLQLSPEVMTYLQELKQLQQKIDQGRKAKPSAQAIQNQKQRYRNALPKTNKNKGRHRFD